MHYIKTLLFAAAVAVSSVPGTATAENLTVVELYTSEGCSSCPPADAFVGELAGRDDVLALSLHVDYWDYIGWKDPFADARHTKRQRKYAKQFQLRYVYTPQVVVDGAFEAVGSDRNKVLDAVSQSKKLKKIPVKLSASADGMVLDLKAADVGAVNVYSVFYDRVHETDVRRGENSGRKLRHANVVRDMTRIATWQGKPTSIPVPASPKGGEVCAVILQSASTGQIIGAARLAIDGKS
jgi:hypothetical protein